ncbi:MAG: ABC transporter ATP-binding protein [Acetatifactor sp.]|nr:ABC transporter ATP-binding protein [Acetatifactor sp.]
MGNVIEVSGLVKNYSDFSLDHVSFQVPEGSITGFIGQNGAGKTTSISAILEIIKRDGGTVRVFGRELDGTDCAWKEDVGVVFDEMGFHDFMTPVEINRMMKYVYKNWCEEDFRAYLKKFGLPGRKRCGKFSRGMRMKLQIAVAMSHKARLLIMDEPTSGLDPIVRNEILQIFQEFVLEENHTIFLSSHITGDLERIADEVVFIDHGRIVLAGNKDEILERHGLLKCKKADAAGIEATDIVSVRNSAFGKEILVRDRAECLKKYRDCVMEQPSLEDIMIFYVNAAGIPQTGGAV